MPLSVKRKASPFQWEIAYNEMKLTAKIGEGSFSDVFLGTWRGIEVAVKMLKNTLSAETFEAFLQEISLVRYAWLIALAATLTLTLFLQQTSSPECSAIFGCMPRWTNSVLRDGVHS